MWAWNSKHYTREEMPKNKGGGGGGKGAKGGGDDDSSKKQAKGGNSVKVILICLTVLPLGRAQLIAT